MYLQINVVFLLSGWQFAKFSAGHKTVYFSFVCLQLLGVCQPPKGIAKRRALLGKSKTKCQNKEKIKQNCQYLLRVVFVYRKFYSLYVRIVCTVQLLFVIRQQSVLKGSIHPKGAHTL